MGRRLFASVLLAACAAIAPAAASGASSQDAAATSTYIRANYALVAAGHANISRTEASVRSVLSQVRRECPTAAIGSPQDEQSTALTNELIGKMVLAGGRPDRPAVASYLRAVGGLRWSSRSVNQAIGSYVRMLRTLYNLASPNLCGDVRAWAASGFKSLPRATGPFVATFIPDWVSLGVLPAGLSRFETAELKAVAKRSGQFESQLMEMEARLVETWGEIMNELQLNP